MSICNIFFELLREIGNIVKASFDLDKNGMVYFSAVLTILVSAGMIFRITNPKTVERLEAEQREALRRHNLNDLPEKKGWSVLSIVCFIGFLLLIISVLI
jgi:hypothetical protein